MAKAPEPAMDKALLKRLLVQSTEKPVFCAFGITRDGGQILVDKIKNPKMLEKELSKLFPDIANTRFGEATVPESDPQLVRVIINRTVSGAARKLTKSLKGTGFKRIELWLEDGTMAEGASDEEEGQVPGNGHDMAPVDAPPTPPPEPSPPQMAPSEPNEEVEKAKHRLAGLIKRLTAAQVPAEEKAKLAAVAKAAMSALNSGAVAGALRSIEPLEQALDRHERAHDVGSSVPVGAAVLGKAKLAWRATRAKVDGEVKTLRETVEAAYKARGLASVVGSAFDKKIGEVMQGLDRTLADDLDAAANASEGPERNRLVAIVKAELKKCQAHLDGPEIAGLDGNPFVKLTVRQTVSATLNGLASAIR